MAEGRKPKVEKDTSERWLLTYADLMNLLLILFIILFAMSQVDAVKFNELASSLNAAFGNGTNSIVGEGGNPNTFIPLETNTEETSMTPEEKEKVQMETIREQVNDLIKKENLKSNLEVGIEERGIVISITEKILFQRGSAQIESEAEATIIKLGKVLLSIPDKLIKIEGHTDSDPINTPKFPDNQELSTARANNVWRILVKKAGINPKIMSVVGYGEFRPKAPNDTPENKAKNRRVDIVILKSEYDKGESGVFPSASPSADTTKP